VRNSETSHFWLGRFVSEKALARYLVEVYDEDDVDREHTPLSEFARDQGEKWYDHDFMEHGYRPEASSVEELVAGHSYSEQWAAELARRATEAGLVGDNMVVSISQDQIDAPRSVKGDGYWLHYLGTIRYRI
jgi:hypothetical protein